MKYVKPISVFKLLEPFLFPYFLFCIASVFFLSGLDSPESYGDDAVRSLCDIKNSGDNIRDFSTSVTILLLLPFIIQLPYAIKNKKRLRIISALFLLLYWWWSFFGIYISCW